MLGYLMYWKELEGKTKKNFDTGTMKNVTYFLKKSVIHFTIGLHCFIRFCKECLIIVKVYFFQLSCLCYDLRLIPCLAFLFFSSKSSFTNLSGFVMQKVNQGNSVFFNLNRWGKNRNTMLPCLQCKYYGIKLQCPGCNYYVNRKGMFLCTTMTRAKFHPSWLGSCN